MAEIKRLLLETRLLTLVGPGGIGKTRLAIRAAQEMRDHYADGIFFVSLAPIHSSNHIVQTISEALRIPLATQENPRQQLVRYLKNKQLLLVIDNFEHLMDGVDLVSEILQAAPDVRIMATSRERLNLISETYLLLQGMSYVSETGDSTPNEAMDLFVQSANKVCPGFEPSSNEFEHIANICRSVQGMPLAIELAAAWLVILTVGDIDKELETGFDILKSEMRDAPERHRSIQAVFDHSWSLLNQSERDIFTRLSIFRGGFTREAARQVADASLEDLLSLVNKSFLSQDAATGRLEIHEFLRQQALERLGQKPGEILELQAQHAAYYAEFMRLSWIQFKGKRQLLALAEIEADLENVRAAWRFYLGQKNSKQLWMFVTPLWQVYWIRGWNLAGKELFAEAASALQVKTDQETQALIALVKALQAYFMAYLGHSNQGYQLAVESAAILEGLDYPEALVFTYDSLLVNAFFEKRYNVFNELSNKMLEISTELDDKWMMAFSLFAISMGVCLQQDYQEARRLALSNLSLNEEIGDVIGSTEPLIVLGYVALASEDHEAARRYYLRCLKISEQIGFYYGIQTSTKYLGKVALSMGRIKEAEKYLHQCMRITNDVGFIRDVVNLLYEFARLEYVQGNPEPAVELLALVLQHPASYESRMLEGRIRDSANHLLATIKDELSPESFSSAMDRGQQLDLDEIVAGLLGESR